MKILTLLRQDSFSKYLVLILVGFFVDHLLTIKLSSVFLSPYKLVLLFLTFMLLLKYNWRSCNSNVVLLFAIFNLIQIISIYYAPAISFSQKINYFGMHLFAIIVTTLLGAISQKIEYKNISNVLIKVLTWVFLLELLVLIIEFIIGGRLFRFGLLDNPDLDLYRMVGFHWERLYYLEYLILGIVAIYFNDGFNLSMKFLFITLATVIIYISDSYTGRLGFAIVVFIILRLSSVKNYVMISITIVLLALPVINDYVFSDFQQQFITKRFENYFIEYETSNWRYYTSLYLIDEFFKAPSILGNGYKANEDKLWNYRKKQSSSHTFVSILYDHGIVGFFIFLLLTIALFTNAFRIFKYIKNSKNKELQFLGILTISFVVITIGRFLFYYHTINQWTYVFCIILVAFFHYFIKRNQLNEDSNIFA